MHVCTLLTWRGVFASCKQGCEKLPNVYILHVFGDFSLDLLSLDIW